MIILQGTFYVLIRQRQSENVFKRVVGSQHLSFDTIMTSGDSTNHYESPRDTCGHCEWRQAVWFFFGASWYAHRNHLMDFSELLLPHFT